ncbi:MAG: DsbA family oxidoreductase [Chloroflexota bacterium]
MRIDLYHDTVCPWCRIGKAHMHQALKQWQGDPVEVHYHTFYLNPDIPTEGYNFREYMTAKGDGQVPLEGWFARPREMGEQVGLKFNFENIEHAPNTTLSHRLIALAPTDQQESMIDAVYAAYFEHGRNIGALDVLLDIATEQGLDRESTREALTGDAETASVAADVQQARQLGVTGVPFFVFNQRYAFSGAQPTEVFLQVMEKVATETPAP